MSGLPSSSEREQAVAEAGDADRVGLLVAAVDDLLGRARRSRRDRGPRSVPASARRSARRGRRSAAHAPRRSQRPARGLPASRHLVSRTSVLDSADGHVCHLWPRKPRRRELLQRLRFPVRAGHEARGAQDRVGPLRGSRRLHAGRRTSIPRTCGRCSRRTGSTCATSSSATAARSRSSSATPSWRSSGPRSRTRTTRSAPCGLRSRSATGCEDVGRGSAGPDRGQHRRGARAARTRPAEGEGMAAGDVVNTASRLQSAAPVNGVIVGEAPITRPATRSTTARPSRWSRRGSRSRCPSGRRSARVARDGRNAEHASLRRSSAGRRSWALLVGALERTRARRGRSSSRVGVPGIGKSRLVTELFARRHASRTGSRGGAAARFPTGKA